MKIEINKDNINNLEENEYNDVIIIKWKAGELIKDILNKFKNVEKIYCSNNNIKSLINTIQIIFNKNNIYANKQYHDPSQIRFNLYEK